MAKKRAAETEAAHDLAVQFGDVGIGEKTCRLGVTLSRDQMALGQADAKLCGRRLIGCVKAKESADHGDQGNLDGFDDPTLTGVFDIKRLGPMQLKKGDKVVFGSYAGNEIEEKGEKFLCLREEDVLAVLE